MELTRQQLVEKWAPVLDAENAPAFKDNYRKEVTAVLLENQERESAKAYSAASGFLGESAPTNSGGTGISLGGANGLTNNVAGFDPVLISLVRRAMPQMIAYDICGVQPMTQPTGLIFAMKSKYSTQVVQKPCSTKPILTSLVLELTLTQTQLEHSQLVLV